MMDSLTLYLKKIKPVLSQDELDTLIEKSMENDREAINKIVEHNLGLVVSIAKKCNNSGIPILDLIQEGNLGLYDAIVRFDKKRNIKFSTYAAFWIKKYIYDAIYDQSRNVKISRRKELQVRDLKRAEYELMQKLQRKPRLEEISEYTDLSIYVIKELKTYMIDTISLDEVIKNVKNNFDDEKSKEELKLENCFPCDFSSSFEKIEEKERNKLIYEVLNCSSLNKREKEIIALRYGFIDGKVLSLQEIANHYNLSRERIRQLEEGALKKIRRNDIVDDLAIYTDDCDRAVNKLKEYRKRYNTKGRCFLSTK